MATLSSEFPETSFSGDNGTSTSTSELKERIGSRVQQMLGYSIHPPFMGHANGLHPLRFIEKKP